MRPATRIVLVLSCFSSLVLACSSAEEPSVVTQGQTSAKADEFARCHQWFEQDFETIDVCYGGTLASCQGSPLSCRVGMEGCQRAGTGPSSTVVCSVPLSMPGAGCTQEVVFNADCTWNVSSRITDDNREDALSDESGDCDALVRSAYKLVNVCGQPARGFERCVAEGDEVRCRVDASVPSSACVQDIFFNRGCSKNTRSTIVLDDREI